MLSFDDLLAARILNQERRDLRQLLLLEIDHLANGAHSRGLVGAMVTSQLIDWDLAQRVLARVETSKQAHALAIYASLVTHAGVPRAQVYGRALSTPQALGRSLIQEGVLTKHEEKDLRFKARVAFDRDVARQVEAFLERRDARAETEEQPRISGVVKLPPSLETLTEPPSDSQEPLSPEELLQISNSELPMPQFPVPGWVDTSGELTGQEMAGYRILGSIGRGASGEVYLADHPRRPDRPVAFKVLRADASDEVRGRFKRAAVATGRFRHPNLLQVFDTGETMSGQPFLAMEFFDGGTLAQVLDSEEKLDPRRALRIARQVFAGLAAAHAAGVVHRDVKPDNILLSADDEQAKLMDFGIAALVHDEDSDEEAALDLLFRSSTGKGLLGTPMYASPEQAYVRKETTHAADLYSMGIVLYEMLAGRIPFHADNMWAYVSCHRDEAPLPLIEAAPETDQLPKTLHLLLDRLLEKEPQDRPKDATTVVEILDGILRKLEGRRTGRWLFGLLGRRRG